ncbi:MAG TPA: HEAT repeat domain-containing protein [Pirellulales bacterium]|nr:HEAT repeat domain-containing protein [Pirellulales bacterium]
MKVRDEVIGTVKRGERFAVVRVQLPWIAVAVERDGRRLVGWLLADKVRAVIDPAIDKQVAPDSPSAFHVEVDGTQVNGTTVRSWKVADGAWAAPMSMRGRARPGETIKLPACYLALRLSLRNDTSTTVVVAPGDFQIHADDRVRAGMDSDEIRRILDTPAAIDFAGNTDAVVPMVAGPIAPAERVEGWLCFDLSDLPVGNDLVRLPKAERWSLSAKWGPHWFDFDLNANEQRALNAKVRPSHADATVSVVETGGRLNALNLAILMPLLERLRAESAVVFQTPGADCVCDDASLTFLRAVNYPVFGNRSPLSRYPKLWYVRETAGGPTASRRIALVPRPRHVLIGPRVATESLAVLQILGDRPQTGERLISFLSGESPELRAAAARALAKHLSEDGVVRAIAAATKDADRSVRVAALYALAAPLAVALPEARQRESADTVALVEALSDGDGSVRSAAASSAWVFPLSSVEGKLISLLDDAEIHVRTAACQSLGRLKSQACGHTAPNAKPNSGRLTKCSAECWSVPRWPSRRLPAGMGNFKHTGRRRPQKTAAGPAGLTAPM